MGILGICNDDKEIESFAQKLEQKAREELVSPGGQFGYVNLSSLIQDDIALIVNQIDQLRTRGKGITQSLLQSECYIETELIQMEDRTPRYSPYRFPEREKLQRRLSRIAEERRRFTTTHAEKLDLFHDRLLSLLKKSQQLSYGKKGH